MRYCINFSNIKSLKKLLIELVIYYLDQSRFLAKITSSLSRQCSKPQSSRIHVYQFIIYPYLLTTSIRLVIFGIALRKSLTDCVLQRLEPTFWTIKIAFEMVTSSSFFSIALVPLYVVYLQHLYDWKVVKISALKLLADFFVHNAQDFWRLNFRFLFERIFRAPQSIRQAFTNLRAIWSGEEDRWINLKHPDPLPHYQHVSRRIRVQAALQSTVLELLYAFITLPCTEGGLLF